MGPIRLPALALTIAIEGALVLSGCGDRVEQYPEVEREGTETTEGGEQTPARRAQPPDNVHGPLPPDEPAGEETEPL